MRAVDPTWLLKDELLDPAAGLSPDSPRWSEAAVKENMPPSAEADGGMFIHEP
jgi:hypothetical protein